MAKRDASSAAMVIKIDKVKLVMDVEDEFANIRMEDLEESKSKSAQEPRAKALGGRLERQRPVDADCACESHSGTVAPLQPPSPC